MADTTTTLVCSRLSTPFRMSSAVLQNPSQPGSLGGDHQLVGVDRGEGQGELPCRVAVLVLPQWSLCLWRSPIALGILVVTAGKTEKPLHTGLNLKEMG